MAEILQFFKTIEIWIYLLLGLAGLFYVFRFLRAWDEMKQAAFGLEHESAQQRLNRAATGLVFLVARAVIEFVLVSFIIPIIPESTPLPTPTLDCWRRQRLRLLRRRRIRRKPRMLEQASLGNNRPPRRKPALRRRAAA